MRISCFRVSVSQKADRWIVTAEVPGFKKKDVSVEVHDGILEILASSPVQVEEEEGGDDLVKWHKVERTMGSLHRAVKLPQSADLDQVKARLKNGMLQVVVAKKPGYDTREASPHRVPLDPNFSSSEDEKMEEEQIRKRAQKAASAPGDNPLDEPETPWGRA